MKFENMVIYCEKQYEKEKVISFLKNNNCKHLDSFLKEGNYIAVYPETLYFTIYKDNITASDDAFYTYQQFMEKYGMSDLQKKVEEAKKTLGLNNHGLSLKLGHQKRYITNALLDPSVKRQKNIILKIDALLLKESGELTHNFEGKSLHKHIDDAMMIPKSEYESMKKEIDHKTQIAEKHADMRNKAELRVSELEKECSEKDTAIKQQLVNSGNLVYKINELENQVKSLQKDFLNSDTEVGFLKEKLHLSDLYGREYWDKYFHQKRLNSIVLSEKYKISIWLAVSILIIVVMLAFGVLHFNGVV